MALSGRTTEKSKIYRNVQDFLVDNPVIRDGVPFELEVENNSVPKGVYEFRGSDTIVNIRTHQSYPADISVFNGKKKTKIRIVTELEITSSKRVSYSAGRQTLTYLTSGIDSVMQSEKLGSTERAELAAELNKSQHLKGKMLNNLLVEQAEAVTRKVVSVDFESYVDSEQRRISFQNTYSAGITETTETLFDVSGPGAEALPGSPKQIALRKDKLTTYFDVNKVSDYLDKGASEKNKYGRKNIALMYDSMRAYVSGESVAPSWMNERQKRFFEKTRERVVAKLGPVAEKLKSLSSFNIATVAQGDAKNYTDNFIRLFEAQFEDSGDSPRTLKGFLNVLKETADQAVGEKDKQLAAHQTSHMVYGEVNLGVVQRQLDVPRGGQTYYEETRITNNLRGSVTKAINKSKSKNVSIYSAAEMGAYTTDINALEAELRSAEARGASQDVLNNINKSLIALKEARSKLVDMKSVTETLFDRLLPEIKRSLSDSSAGITRIIEKFVPADVLKGLQESTVGSFIGDKGKGLSLENLYQILVDKDAVEYHTGALDSRDLNHLRLTIENIFSSSKGYKSNSVQRIKGTNLRAIMDSPYGLVDLSSTVARKVQQKIVTDYVTRESSIDDLFKIVTNKESGFSNVGALTDLYYYAKNSTAIDLEKNENKFREAFKKEMEGTLIRKMDADFNSASQQYKAQMERLSKYSTESPGILAKVMTTPALSRVAALAGFLWLTRNTAEDKPGASIETGEHNAMETVARRVMTTPFNSAISLGVVGKFAKSIVGRLKSKASILSKFDLSDGFIQNMEKRALMPMVVSSEKRAQRELLKVEKYSSLVVSSSPRVQKMVMDRTLRNRLSSPMLNKKLQDLVKAERLSTWDDLKLSSREIKQVKGRRRYAVSNGFFVGSSGPSTKVQTFGLTSPRPGRDVYIDQSNVFGFMKQNAAVLSADESFIAARTSKVYSLDVPSFNPYWVNRTHMSKKTFKSATIVKEPVLLPYNQEVVVSPTGFVKDQQYVSSVIAGRKSLSKYDRFVTLNRGSPDLKNYYDYDDTLMKVSSSSAGEGVGRSLLYAAEKNRSRVPNTTIIGVPDSLLDSKPVLVSSTKKHQFIAPIHSQEKGIDRVLRPIVRQPKRLDPNDYINDANMMLTGKGGFQTAGNYPASTSQVMGYINDLALRY